MKNTQYFCLDKIIVTFILVMIHVSISYRDLIVDTQNFKELLSSNKKHFVDKSLFIEEFLTCESKVALITRPKHFGKSLNVDMLKTFFEIEVDQFGNLLKTKENKKYFTNLKIAKSHLKILNNHTVMSYYQGKFPVIHLSFENARGSTFKDIRDGIIISVRKMFNGHSYLFHLKNPIFTNVDLETLKKYDSTENLDDAELTESLIFLSSLLFKYFNQKVFIFVDDYDTPVYQAFFFSTCTKLQQTRILNIITLILKKAYKNNIYLEKGLICGITYTVSKAATFSVLNNVIPFTMLDEEFSKSFGFTELEISTLLKKLRKSDLLNNIKLWYNGYHLHSNDFSVYNPWSIMKFLQNKKNSSENYWENMDDYAVLLEKSFNRCSTEEMKVILNKLIQNGSPNVYISKQFILDDLKQTLVFNSSLFYTLGVHYGYLNAEHVAGTEYKVKIPNAEVHSILEKLSSNWIARRMVTDDEMVEIGDTIMKALREKNFHQVIKKLSSYFGKQLDPILAKEKDFLMRKEIWYHGCIYLFVLRSNYRQHFEIYSEMKVDLENGTTGILDLVLIPFKNSGTVAYLIEFKVATSAKQILYFADLAKNQTGPYTRLFNNVEYMHIKEILKVGMAFYNSDIEIAHETIYLSP